ncbi:hypothetical protein [Candidatus Poriferisodalis sp.]|uniref:hypothetical protein n=1 Tax=Candidatus Poriferisodalis sp. TaxID=3101277 RepID=UPI003B026AA7
MLDKPDQLYWKEQCEESAQALLNVGDHAYSLARCLKPHADAEMVPAAHKCSEWLMLAAGLKEVTIVTNGLDHQDTYCSNTHEEERGRVASASAVELTRLLFAWGALDLALRNSTSAVIRARSISQRLINLMESDVPILLHHSCAINTMMRLLSSSFSILPNDILDIASRKTASDAVRATLCAYYLRNTLAHGSLVWPVEEADGAIPHLALGRVSTRLLLFAVQTYILSVADLDGLEYQLSDVTDEYEWIPLRDFVPKLHLRPVLD